MDTFYDGLRAKVMAALLGAGAGKLTPEELEGNEAPVLLVTFCAAPVIAPIGYVLPSVDVRMPPAVKLCRTSASRRRTLQNLGRNANARSS